jgi:hypothetical protein
MAAGAAMEAAQVELLVRAVHLVVLQPEAHQHGVQPEHVLQVGHHRDRAAAADQRGRLAVFVGQRGLCGADEAAFRRYLDPGARAEDLEACLRIGRQRGADEGLEALEDLLVVLAGDQPEGDLRMRLEAITVLLPGPV